MSLYLNNSISIEIELTNSFTSPIYVNDALVTARIVDLDGVEVKANFPLPYLASSNGVYRETIDPVPMVNGEIYTVIIDAVGSDGIIGRFDNKIKAAIKKS